MASRVHYWEVDALKGLAILGVLAIHAELLGDSLFHQTVVNRSVYIMLVLFGVSSEAWWRQQPESSGIDVGTKYWRSRFSRLLPPMWCAVACWWLIVHVLPGASVPAWPWVALHAAGYLPQVGTGWFITLIVQLVVLFPLFHFGLSRLGPWVFCSLGLAITVVSNLGTLHIVDWMRFLLLDTPPKEGFFIFYSFWIFAPAKCFLVFAGMVLAQNDLRLRRDLAITCVALLVVGSFVHRTFVTDVDLGNAIVAALDVPLTIALLSLLRWGCPAAARPSLCWLGRASWGIYLGQLVVHNALSDVWHQKLGADVPMRALYFCCLLLGGLAWVLAERGVARVVPRFQQVLERVAGARLTRSVGR